MDEGRLNIGQNGRQTRGLSARNGPRVPLGNLASAHNRPHQKPNFPDGPVKPTQTFTVYRESSSSNVNDENRPPSSFHLQPQQKQHVQQQKQFVWPQQHHQQQLQQQQQPQLTNRLNFVIHNDEQPQAASSPARTLSSTTVDGDDIDVDNYASLYSQSSASEFRSKNDSLSSTTTNEEDDCDDIDDDDDVAANVENVAGIDGDLEIVAEVDDGRQQPHDVICCVDEYALEIMKLMMKRESNFMPKWNYMTKQPDITFTMRSILIDWLVEVGEEYKLNTETLFLAINYIDRFLSFMSVQRAKLQLVGTACMFIAAKYEEIYPPELSEFCYITDDTYTKRQVMRMEQLVLSVLNFECAPPTAHFFVNHMAKMAGCGDESRALAQYLAELTLMDAASFLPFAPSIIGAASVALARHTLGLAAWEDAMIGRTGYVVDDFKECLVRIHGIFTKAPELQQQAIREKYRNAKYHSVSEVQPTPIF